MSPDERRAVLLLGRGGPPDTVLEVFGVTDGAALGGDLLRAAVEARDSDEVELALIVCFRFGITEELRPLLEQLCHVDWHRSHENVVSALGDIRSPDSVDALLLMAQHVPDYLGFDDARALAVKAVWALGSIEGVAARSALEQLARSEIEIVRNAAVEQLRRGERQG